MNNTYENKLNSERTVEIEFMVEKIREFAPGTSVLDVGGIPSVAEFNKPMVVAARETGCRWEVADFRGGHYHGDFVTFNFGDKKFDRIIFLSSLEHFCSCTEGDLVFRAEEDKAGFQKALSILADGGQIIITVPYGKFTFQPHHYSYDQNRIEHISEGMKIKEQFVYTLQDNVWNLVDKSEVTEIVNPGPVYSVGLFVFERA